MMREVIASVRSGVPGALKEVITLGRTLNRRAGDILAHFDRPGTGNGPTGAITAAWTPARFGPGLPEPHQLTSPGLYSKSADSGHGYTLHCEGTVILLRLHSPAHVRRIRLNFVETQAERTQEYVLRWSPDGGATMQEIVRQQWNCSPQDATRQSEGLHVDLAGVTLRN